MENPLRRWRPRRGPQRRALRLRLAQLAGRLPTAVNIFTRTLMFAPLGHHLTCRQKATIVVENVRRLITTL